MEAHEGFPSDDALSHLKIRHAQQFAWVQGSASLDWRDRNKITILFPRLLPITMTLPKCSLHKCDIITVSGIKNVNDECYASGRMIK